jgi:hypothetical protein
MSRFENVPHNWTFLGKSEILVAAPRTGTVTWTGGFRNLWVRYFIAGSAVSGVARILPGPTAGPNEAGLLCANSIIENSTLTTTSVSVSGWIVNGAANTHTRFGDQFIFNQQNLAKRMWGRGPSAVNPPVATTAPIQFSVAGHFVDTTNLINSFSLVNYTLITGNVIGSNFNVGTYISVWGRNDE